MTQNPAGDAFILQRGGDKTGHEEKWWRHIHTVEDKHTGGYMILGTDWKVCKTSREEK